MNFININNKVKDMQISSASSLSQSDQSYSILSMLSQLYPADLTTQANHYLKLRESFKNFNHNKNPFEYKLDMQSLIESIVRLCLDKDGVILFHFMIDTYYRH